MIVVSWDTEIGMQSSNCGIGKQIIIHGLTRLLIGKDGSQLPKMEKGMAPDCLADWDHAVKHQQGLQNRSTAAMLTQQQLTQALRERRGLLERDENKIPGFPELQPYAPLLSNSLRQQHDLEQDTEKFSRFCASYKEATPEGLELISWEQERLRKAFARVSCARQPGFKDIARR